MSEFNRKDIRKCVSVASSILGFEAEKNQNLMSVLTSRRRRYYGRQCKIDNGKIIG